MNWNAVGAVGQILGSLATFVTVGYLVVQVHDTERDIKRSIAQGRAERNMEINLAESDERIATIRVKGVMGLIASDAHLMPDRPPVAAAFEEFVRKAGLTPDQVASLQSAANGRVPPFLDALTRQAGLTVEEAVSLNSVFQARWNNTSQTILYIDDLPPGDRAQFDNTTRGGFSEPLAHLWYESVKSDYNPDVVRYVDHLLAQPG